MKKSDSFPAPRKSSASWNPSFAALEEDAHCADILQRLAAARGAINTLMGKLMEDHILNHMPRKTESSAEAAEELIEIVRTYLK